MTELKLPNFVYKSCPKASTALFALIVIFSNRLKSGQIFWATFVVKMCQKCHFKNSPIWSHWPTAASALTPAKGGRESWSSGRSERPGRESVPTYERLCTSRLNLGMFVVRLYLWASEREREREREGRVDTKANTKRLKLWGGIRREMMMMMSGDNYFKWCDKVSRWHAMALLNYCMSVGR